MFVRVRKNGVQTGKDSDVVRGWEVEFERTKRHTFEIVPGPTDTYTVEVWDDHTWSRNVLIFNVTGLAPSDFDKAILEHIGTLDPPERAARVEFVRVK